MQNNTIQVSIHGQLKTIDLTNADTYDKVDALLIEAGAESYARRALTPEEAQEALRKRKEYEAEARVWMIDLYFSV